MITTLSTYSLFQTKRLTLPLVIYYLYIIYYIFIIYILYIIIYILFITVSYLKNASVTRSFSPFFSHYISFSLVDFLC